MVREHNAYTCGFNIRGGVRQGYALSPSLVGSVLEIAVSSWRAKMEAGRLSLQHGHQPLLELQFSDDILIFCRTLDRACLSLDDLFVSLAARLGVTLNLTKIKIVATVQQLQSTDGVTARAVLEERVAQLESNQATKENTNDVTEAVDKSIAVSGGFGETTVEEQRSSHMIC